LVDGSGLSNLVCGNLIPVQDHYTGFRLRATNCTAEYLGVEIACGLKAIYWKSEVKWPYGRVKSSDVMMPLVSKHG